MVLHSDGLWHKVLCTKYMKNLSVADWLRGNDFNSRGVSLIWRDFLQSLPWLGRCLSWLVGNGNDIILGIDPIVGSQATYLLPLELREYLAVLDIVTLSQAHNTQPNAQHYWFTVEELNLAGDLKLAWDGLIRGL